MRPKELLIISLAVFGFSHSQKGNAQENYDISSDNVFYRDIQGEAPTDPTSSGYLSVKTVNYAGLIGHAASPTPVRIPLVYVIALASVLAVVLVLLALWLITHLVRKRQRSLLQKEFTMTSEDAHLSSMALENDPFKRINSYEYFSVPMPDTPRLTPQISLTSTEGTTTHLYP